MVLLLPVLAFGQGIQPVNPLSPSGSRLFPNAFASADNIAAQTATAMHGLTYIWDGANWDRWSGAVSQSGTWNINNISGTVTLPTGASTLGEQQTQTTALQLIDDVVHASDAALSKVAAIGCQFDDVAPGTTTENNVRPARCSTRREAYTQIRDAAGNERGLNVDANGEIGIGAIRSALPTGANAIGKLAANSGIDIGDVDVTSIIPGTGATNLGKAEDAQHTSADTGVMLLGVRNDADGTPFASSGTDGDYTPIATDKDGAVMVTGQHPEQWTYHEDSSSALTDTTVHASCGAGLYNYIGSLVVSTGAATAFNVFIEDSTTTKILGPYYLEAVAGRGAVMTFVPPKKQANSATLISITTSAAIAHAVDIQGFCAP